VRLIEPTLGRIEIAGLDLARLRGSSLRRARLNAAVIFQQVNMVRRRTALDNVAFGALGRLPLARSVAGRAFPPEVREAAFDALERVGLVGKAYQLVGTLSGGQAQRVAIARALCQGARVILADEPVASLDPHASASVLELLADVAHREDLAVLCVLHQPELARTYADRLVGMLRGRITFDAVPHRVDPTEVTALYAGERGGRTG
jgi:phosphonate transport system ATP-binding protein